MKKKSFLSFFIIVILWILFLRLPLPYYVINGGGVIDTTKRINIEGIKPQKKGNFNLAYVSVLEGRPWSYLLGKIIPSWEVEKVEDYTYDKKEDMESVTKRDNLELEESIRNAIKVSYLKAGKKYEVKEEHYYIYYDQNKKLNVQDEVLGYDGIKLNDMDEFKKYILNHKIGDKIKLKIKRNNKIFEEELEVKEEKNIPFIGIMLIKMDDYYMEPKVQYKFESSEAGPSGGLTLALATYNMLIDEDITKGKKIVGTGTIDSEGNVGQIGGVLYKLKGAISAKADVFIVPKGENSKEVKKEVKKKKYKIKVVEVKTFSEALNKLKEVV